MAQALARRLVAASLYALLGAGYVLVYRASRVLNLAQGDLLTLGGYFLFATAATFPGQPVLALPLAAGLSALTGVLVYVALMRPMAGHPVFAAVLVTVTLGIPLRAAIVFGFPDRTRHPLPNLRLEPSLGILGLRAFAVALVGGLDSLGGVIPAAILVAAVEVMSVRFGDPLLSDVSPFLCLLVMLLIRPWGLFGTKEELERV